MAGYNDIEGAAVFFGESPIRGGRIVDYDGAAVHLDTGSSPGSINTNSGQVSLSVLGNIRMPELQARMVEANTHTVGRAPTPLLTPEAVHEGMGKIAKAVDDYTETMDSVRAKNSEFRLREKFFNMYHGQKDAPGFAQKEGMAAVEGYSDFEQSLTSEMKAELEGLNPSARLKAVTSFWDVRNSYLSKAATQVESEKSKLVEGQKQAEREQIRKEFHAYPPDALGQQVLTPDGKVTTVPSELKRRFYSTFSSDKFELAGKMWGEEVKNAGTRLYLNKRGYTDEKGVYHIGKGLEEAKIFRDVIGQTELSQDDLVELDKSIFSWENAEIQNYTENYNLRERREEKAMKRQQNTNEAQLNIDLFSGEKMYSQSDVWRLAKAQVISEEGARAYVTNLERKMKGEDIVTNPAKMLQYKDMALASVDNNFITSDGESVIQKALGDPEIRNNDKEELTNFFISTRKDADGNLRKRGYEVISSIIPGTKNILTGEKTGQAAVIESQARTAYDNYVKSFKQQGKDIVTAHGEALIKVQNTYEKEKLSFEVLTPFYDGGKPSTPEAFDKQMDKVTEDYKKGAIPKGMYFEQMSLAIHYRNTIQSILALNKKSKKTSTEE